MKNNYLAILITRFIFCSWQFGLLLFISNRSELHAHYNFNGNLLKDILKEIVQSLYKNINSAGICFLKNSSHWFEGDISSVSIVRSVTTSCSRETFCKLLWIFEKFQSSEFTSKFFSMQNPTTLLILFKFWENKFSLYNGQFKGGLSLPYAHNCILSFKTLQS